MKATLEELKGSIGGIIGSFVIGGKGDVLVHDVPEIMSGATPRVSKTIYHVVGVISSTKKLEKMTVDSENGKLITLPAGDKILVVVAEKTINVPLLKLMSNMAVSRIKAEPAPVKAAAPQAEEKKEEAAPAAEGAEVERICDLYDKMFDLTAKKITLILGPGAAKIFGEQLGKVSGRHSALLKDVSVGGNGKPDIGRLKANAKSLSKDELTAGLEDILLAMIEAVKSTAGEKIAEKTLNETNKIKEEQKI